MAEAFPCFRRGEVAAFWAAAIVVVEIADERPAMVTTLAFPIVAIDVHFLLLKKRAALCGSNSKSGSDRGVCIRGAQSLTRGRRPAFLGLCRTDF